MQSLRSGHGIALATLSAVALTLVTFGARAESNGPVLDQACETSLGTDLANSGGTQSFTPGLREIGRVDVNIHKASNGSSRIKILRGTNTLYTSGWSPQGGLPGVWVGFELPSGSVVSPVVGETLTLAVEVTGGLAWNLCTPTYSSGAGEPCGYPQCDYMFRTYAPQDSTSPTLSIGGVERAGLLAASNLPGPGDTAWRIGFTTIDDIFPTVGVSISVVNAATGLVVRTASVSAPEAQQVWAWDGTTDLGAPALPILYLFQLVACDGVPLENGTPNCTTADSQTFLLI
jgi:hypothetical protein